MYVDEALKSDEVEVDGKKVKATNFLRTLIDNNSERLTNEEMAYIALELFGAGIDSVIVEAVGLLVGLLAAGGRLMVWVMVEAMIEVLSAVLMVIWAVVV